MLTRTAVRKTSKGVGEVEEGQPLGAVFVFQLHSGLIDCDDGWATERESGGYEAGYVLVKRVVKTVALYGAGHGGWA